MAVGVVVIAECHALVVGEAVKVWSHRALQSYHLTLPLAVDVVSAYLSAGGLGGFALAVLGLNLCHTEDLQTFQVKETKKDRHAGRPMTYNNVEKQRAGTEAEDVGVVSRLSKCYCRSNH